MRFHLDLSKTSLSYLDIRPEKQVALVFLHGNSQSAEFFRPLLKDPRLDAFRLIAVDLPGHGESGVLPTYRFSDFRAALVQLLKHLQLETYLLIGNSFGGHVITQSLDVLSPMGVVLCGAPPLKKPLPSNAFHALPTMAGLYMETVAEDALLDLGRDLGFHPLDAHFGEAFHQTDPRFRSSLAEIVGEQDLKDEVECLTRFNGAVSLACGAEDPVVNAEYVREVAGEIGARFKRLPGGHSFLRYDLLSAIDFLLREVEHALLPQRFNLHSIARPVDESARPH